MATVTLQVDTTQVRQLVQQAKSQLDALNTTLGLLADALKNVPVVATQDPTPPVP